MKDEEVLMINDSGWKAAARELVRKKREFTLVERGYKFAIEDCEAFANESDYTLEFDPDKRQAIFKPRVSN